MFASVSKAALRADTSRMASLKSSPESVALARRAKRSGPGCAVIYCCAQQGCRLLGKARMVAKRSLDVGESRFHLASFSLKAHQCMGGEALRPLLGWVAWKPTAEPTLGMGRASD